MKYESNILKRLIDTYGVVGNPRYISEIIKEFIVQGKERFPDLFTYQADWLAHIDEFGLNPSYSVSYTGQSIYAPNTLERPVKSAILKGCTAYRDIDTGEILETFEEGRNLELVSVKMPVLTTTGKNLFKGETIGADTINGDEIYFREAHNKNGAYLMVDESMIGKTYTVSCYAKRKPSNNFVVIALDKNNRELKVLQQSLDTEYRYVTQTVTIPQNTVKLLITMAISGQTREFWVKQLQIEENTTATSYEPYKTNILTVNEEVTLRGIGDVQDTLDCLTGEVTQRIGEYQITGEENWYFLPSRRRLQIQNPTFTPNIKCGVFACDKLQAKQGNDDSLHSTNGTYYIGCTSDNWLRIILGEDLTSLEQGKEWLKANKPTIQYQLATESIKTVDLNILDQNGQNIKQLMSFNGGTHFNTGSLEGSLIPSVSVTVETDLEETLKVCSIEGNTM